MSIADKLAVSLGRRDETPNIELAETIAAQDDKKAVKELVAILQTGTKKLQSDCIKVLYETAARKPELVAPYYSELSVLLNDSNNRLVWGAMTALNSLTLTIPHEIYGLLDELIEVADKGSVITKDHLVSILVKLGGMDEYKDICTKLLLAQLDKAPNNQFAMYAEQIAPVIGKEDHETLSTLMKERIPVFEKESQQKRVSKLLKKIGE